MAYAYTENPSKETVYILSWVIILRFEQPVAIFKLPMLSILTKISDVSLNPEFCLKWKLTNYPHVIVLFFCVLLKIGKTR